MYFSCLRGCIFRDLCELCVQTSHFFTALKRDATYLGQSRTLQLSPTYPRARPAIERRDATWQRRRQRGQDDSALPRPLPAPALEQRQLTLLGRGDRAAA